MPISAVPITILEHAKRRRSDMRPAAASSRRDRECNMRCFEHMTTTCVTTPLKRTHFECSTKKSGGFAWWGTGPECDNLFVLNKVQCVNISRTNQVALLSTSTKNEGLTLLTPFNLSYTRNDINTSNGKTCNVTPPLSVMKHCYITGGYLHLCYKRKLRSVMPERP